MKKLLSLLAATGLVATSGSVAIACNKNKDADSSTEKKDLSVLETKELGEVTGTSDLPTAADLVKAINSKNKDYGLTSNDVDLDGKPTTTSAKLKAKDSSTKFTGTVEVKYTYKKDDSRANFDLSLVSQVIDNTGQGALARPNSFNIGYLMVSDIKDQTKIYSDLDRFIGKVVDKAKLLYPTVTKEAIMGMINIDYIDANGNKIQNGVEVASIKGSVKDGHADDIDKIHAVGTVEIKIKEYKKLSNFNFNKNLGELSFSNPSDLDLSKEEFLGMFKTKNETAIKDFPYDQLEIRDFSLEKGTAKIGVQINGDCSQEDIDLTFTIGKSAAQFNLSSWTTYSIYYPFIYDDYESSGDLKNRIVDYLYDVNNNIEFWQKFSSDTGSYLFIGQKAASDDQSTTTKDGTIDKSTFVADFESIIDINNKDNSNTDITISFKESAKDKYQGYTLVGSANITKEPSMG
ncbi:hypothetical protein SHELI_v1c10290 [Spiroplasma helicoides]|uniref:Uncharacterized protein n=1 Tax=Spiroplasma helicoides TaxID=216938 RepID=A0A1B3SM10_9MOLU|nr:lipoprotein [Spiroplasma helicoides]AOG60976.1 hypothetical protein SHELI_v1c10290 [Spiroplasma helicoides]